MSSMIHKPFIHFSSLIMVLVLFATHAVATDTLDPKLVVEKTVSNIIIALEAREDQSRLTESNRQSIRDAVEGVFDYRTMSRYSLGKAWKPLNEAARASFTEVFRELMERSYGNRLSAYHGQEVSFADTVYKKKKARVKSLVIDSNKTTPIEYRLHQPNGQWMVYDIRIEGVSLIRTFRDDFKSTLKKMGFDGLLDALRKRVARLKEKDKEKA